MQQHPQSQVQLSPPITIRNTGKDQQLIDLLSLRNLISKQLYLMSKITITKTLFDGVHYSMLLKNQDGELVGGLTYYLILKHACANIIYFVIEPNFQVRGYGQHLMTSFKQHMRNNNYKTIVAQADTLSLNFYYKNGFTQFQRKNKKLQRQPTEYLQDQQTENEDSFGHNTKYKRYEPWLDYLEEYYSSVLVVYEVPQKVDFWGWKQIVAKQREGLITVLDGRSYRNHTFKREEMENLIKQHRECFQSWNGPLRDPKKESQTMARIKNLLGQLVTTQSKVSKMQQIALLQVLIQHPKSYILRLQFLKIPDSFHDELSSPLSLQMLCENVLQGKYGTTEQFCAEITKMFENLRLFLSSGTNYFRACEELQMYMRGFLEQVYMGVFDVVGVIQKYKLLSPDL